jgi:hypothetical protein
MFFFFVNRPLHIHICTYVHIHICRIQMYAYPYLYMYICTQTHTYVCTYMSTCTHSHMFEHICTHTHMYVHVQVVYVGESLSSHPLQKSRQHILLMYTYTWVCTYVNMYLQQNASRNPTKALPFKNANSRFDTTTKLSLLAPMTTTFKRRLGARSKQVLHIGVDFGSNFRPKSFRASL